MRAKLLISQMKMMLTNLLLLAQTINPIQSLNVVGGVPVDVHNDRTVGANQIDSNPTGLRRYKQDTGIRQQVVEHPDSIAAGILRGRSVDSVIIPVGTPRAHLDDVVLPLTWLVRDKKLRGLLWDFGHLCSAKTVN